MVKQSYSPLSPRRPAFESQAPAGREGIRRTFSRKGGCRTARASTATPKRRPSQALYNAGN